MTKETKTKPKDKNKTKEETSKMTTIDFDLNDAEDFKLPSDGVHYGNLTNAELAITKKTQDFPEDDQRKQIVLTLALSPDDPDAPNLPMRFYLGLPYPEDKDTMWGSRTAWGSKIKSIKDALTAFGGQESGSLNQDALVAFFQDNFGMSVKVKIKQSKREDTDEMQANIQSLMPA